MTGVAGIWRRLDPPDGRAVPLLFDLPHSGRDYPADFGAALPMARLRAGEDAYLDDMLAGVEGQGVTVLQALFPRTYIDANRRPDDLDADLIDGPWPGALDPGPKTAMGIGLIRRVVTPETPIYDRKLSAAEVHQRIETYYRPYRQVLADTIADLRSRFGTVWHIDWHSMKSVGNAATPDGNSGRRPDMVIGDGNGTACDPAFSAAIGDWLGAQGFSISHNVPYAGGDIVRSHGRPDQGVHSLQIEMNRDLYLDEVAVEKTGGYAALQQSLSLGLVPMLVNWVQSRRDVDSQRMAAR